MLSIPAMSSGRWIALLAVAGLIGLETLASWLGKRGDYDRRETIDTLVVAIGGRLIATATAGLAALPLVWVYQHRLLDFPVASLRSLAALFLGVELCYYWHHRAMHRVNCLWATHVVHHSSTRLNLSAALRLGWGGALAGGSLFYLPLAWLGFHPLAILATLGAGLAYQFFLHVARPPRLGPLEWLLNSPIHHHVHHAANDACLDKNFGGVLLVFDRAFGTFAEPPDREDLRFGVKEMNGLAGHPIDIALMGWRGLIRSLRAAPTWHDRWRVCFGRPA